MEIFFGIVAALIGMICLALCIGFGAMAGLDYEANKNRDRTAGTMAFALSIMFAIFGFFAAFAAGALVWG